MMKKTLATTLVSALLLFSGCANSDGEDRLETQQMLDDGDYEGIISKLEGNAVTDEDNLALASAYMLRAGLGFSDLITVMADSTEGDDENGFASFAKTLKDSSSDTALTDLGLATDYYKSVVGEDTCDSNATLTNSQKDICLFIGLTSTMKAATTISYLGDLTTFGSADNPDGPDDSLTASICAMRYAYDGNDSNIDSSCTVTLDENVTFASNRTYTQLLVRVAPDNYVFDYLITAPILGIRQTAVTDGYCLEDFSDEDFIAYYDNNYTKEDRNITAFPDVNGIRYYPCPVNKEDANSSEELTAASILVDVLNDGIDSIISTMGVTDDGEDSDSTIAADIEEFKLEIINSSLPPNEQVTEVGDLEIELDDILNYLDDQN